MKDYCKVQKYSHQPYTRSERVSNTRRLIFSFKNAHFKIRDPKKNSTSIMELHPPQTALQTLSQLHRKSFLFYFRTNILGAFVNLFSYRVHTYRRRKLLGSYLQSLFVIKSSVTKMKVLKYMMKMNLFLGTPLDGCFCNKISSFQNLLDQDISVLVHTRNLQTLVIEIYKVSKGIATKIFTDIFRYNIFSCNSRDVISLSLVDLW